MEYGRQDAYSTVQCTRSHLNLEYLPRLRPELLYSKNLGERVQRRVFHNQARCQNIPKREVLGEHWLAKKKKKKKKTIQHKAALTTCVYR